MSTIATGRPHPARYWPANKIMGVIRDVIAGIVILICLFYHWNADGKGTSHWYVIVSVCIGLVGVIAVLLSSVGGLGPVWNNGFNRLIRLVAALPMLASVIAVILIDVFSSGAFGSGKLVGAGAIIGGGGVLLLAQSRSDERGPVPSSLERAGWTLVSLIFGAAAVITLVLTTALEFSTSSVLPSVLSLASSIVLALLVAAGIIGVLARRRPLHNLMAGMGVFLFAAAVLSFDSDWSIAGNAFGLIQSTHAPGFGVVLVALSGMAAMSSEARSGLPQPSQNENVAAVSWIMMAGFVVALVNLLQVVQMMATQSDAGMTIPGSVIALTICVGAIAVVTVGAAILARLGGTTIFVAFGLTGLTIAIGIAVAILGDNSPVPNMGWSWFVPLVVLVTAIAAWLGLAGLQSMGEKMSASLQAAATPPPGDAGPAAAADTTAPGTAATPAADQPDGSAQAATSAPATASAPPPPPTDSPPPTDPDVTAAQDPSTSPAELARLAAEAPHTRALIARHPQAYPGLLDWLGNLDDPEVNEALRKRNG